MSKEESIRPIQAILKEEIDEIKEGLKPSLDVLVVGMNPSLSQWTYKQLYNCLKKRKKEGGLLKVLNILSQNGEGGEEFVGSLNDKKRWNKWVGDTFFTPQADGKAEAFSALQYFFVEGKEKSSIDPMSWPVVGQKDDLSKKKTIPYFNAIRKTLAAGLKAMQTEPDLNDDQRKLTWYHIDLFHYRETDQESLLASLKDGGEWSDNARKAVEVFWEQVKDLKPHVLLVANSNVSDLIFSNYDDVLKETFNLGSATGREGFGKKLEWDRDSFSLRIKADPSEQMPKVVFSRQLSRGASNAMLYFVAKEIGRMLSSTD